MTAQQTFGEMVDSLTGYEEERIEGHFGGEITHLLNMSSTKSARALIFIDKIRDGLKSETADENKVVQAAKRFTQGLTIAEVNQYFQNDEDEPDPMDTDGDQGPTTEAGKGGRGPATEPVS